MTFADVSQLTKAIKKMSATKMATWDVSDKNDTSIKTHIRRFEDHVEEDELDTVEKARELARTLRGQAAAFAEELPDSERKDYEKLKMELLETFDKPKPIQTLMKEFQEYKWVPTKQTIREFAAALQIKWNKMQGGTEVKKPLTDHEKAILANRLIDGIKNARPKFGSSLEFLLDGDDKNFKQLAVTAESKYDIFRDNTERIEETNNNDVIFINKEPYHHVDEDSIDQKGNLGGRYKADRSNNDQNHSSEQQNWQYPIIPDYNTLVEFYLQYHNEDENTYGPNNEESWENENDTTNVLSPFPNKGGWGQIGPQTMSRQREHQFMQDSISSEEEGLSDEEQKNL